MLFNILIQKQILKTLFPNHNMKKIIFLLACLLCVSCAELSITSVDNIRFTDTLSVNKALHVPAAYTSKSGTIEGEYRINGVTYGKKSLKEKTSITDNGLVIDTKWHSDNGFQQHVLVKNNRIRKFVDTRKRFRRALCSKGGQYYIIETGYPITLSEFAKMIAPYCDNAVNLDMGVWGYGWVANQQRLVLYKFNKHKQTNWLTV